MTAPKINNSIQFLTNHRIEFNFGGNVLGKIYADKNIMVNACKCLWCTIDAWLTVDKDSCLILRSVFHKHS